MQETFDMNLAVTADELVVTLSGELDLNVHDAVVEQVTRTATSADDLQRIVVDLGGVTFCDSSGLGALLDIRRLADDIGASMTVRSVPAPVARLFELAEVDRWLAVE